MEGASRNKRGKTKKKFKIRSFLRYAEQTELLRLHHRRLNEPNEQLRFRIIYLGHICNLSTVDEIKINGILLQQNEEVMVERNIVAVLKRTSDVGRKSTKRGYEYTVTYGRLWHD